MTTLTYEQLSKFNKLGLREICAYNRDFIYNFNSFNRKQFIELLIKKSKEGYKIVIPKSIETNDKYVKLKDISKSHIKIILNVYIISD